MNQSNKKLLELAMVASIREFTKETQSNGRLNNLYSRLSKIAFKEIEKIPRPSPLEIEKIGQLVDRFGKSTGWLGKEKHIATLASFCLGMIEDSEFNFNPRIVETLNDIIDYFERAGESPAPSFWAGGVAAEKWHNIISEA